MPDQLCELNKGIYESYHSLNDSAIKERVKASKPRLAAVSLMFGGPNRQRYDFMSVPVPAGNEVVFFLCYLMCGLWPLLKQTR